MKVTSLNISDVKLIEPIVFEDERGFFFESFNQEKFNEAIGQEINFVQDNHSSSKKGVLRGLHYQQDPFMQSKLVRVISGEVFDVVVDIRKNSPTYGQWLSENLSCTNKKQLWIPEGFAHGFLVTSDSAEVVYKTTKFYSKAHDRCIRFDDEIINICWPLLEGRFTISNKDAQGHNFSEL
jgi:dTDP-4-dehydrorhamnose 3,5-epimerase